MKIGLIDFDGTIQNRGHMKRSTYWKERGAEVILADRPPLDCDIVYCSVLYTWNKPEAEKLNLLYKNIFFGGTGWDYRIKLPPEVEACKPDYDLYTLDFLVKRVRGIKSNETRLRKAEEWLNMGVGFTSRGCIRNCEFCVVPKAEGKFRQAGEIKDIINPRSNLITLLDNNFTADPLIFDKLKEIRERKLAVNISQGIDVRLVTDEIAFELNTVKHYNKGSIHYAWDLMCFEEQVLQGIKILSKYIKPYRHRCFMLCGFNTSPEEDMYRFRKLQELGVTPYVMVYNNQFTDRLKHFERWGNGFIHKVCGFEEYEPWIKAQQKVGLVACQ